MLIDTAKLESIRQQLALLSGRCDEIRDEANDSGYPSGDPTCATAAVFAARMTELARSIISLACAEIGVTNLYSAISDDAADLIERQLREVARSSGNAPDVVASARIAAAQKMQKLAADVISRAQACLDREETITGEQLHHSPLWYK